MLQRGNVFDKILFIIFVIECVLILYVNFTNTLEIVNEDAANVYVHTAEMWENHNLYIPEWKYETTAEWDCASIFALPVYGITRNIHCSFAFSNMIFLGLFCWTVFRLFRDQHIRVPLLGLCFILIPYSVGMLEYFNMLFFAASQYIIKVLLPLMFISLLLHFENSKKEDVVFLILTCFFAFLTACSSGVYVFGCGITGVICGYLMGLYRVRGGYSEFNKRTTIVIAAIVLCTVVGLIINQRFYIETRGNSLVLRPVGEELWFSPFTSLTAISSMFLSVPEDSAVNMFSKEGIHELMVLLLMSVLLFGVVYTLYQYRKGKAELLPFILSILFIWNEIIQCLNCYGNAGRYHLMGIIPAILVIAYYGGRLLSIRDKKICWNVSLFILVFLIYHFFCGYKLLFQFRKSNPFTEDIGKYMEVVAYAEKEDIEYVYVATKKYWSEICRMIGIGDGIKYLYLNKETGTVELIDYYRKYDETSVKMENAIIVVNNERDSQMEYIALFEDSVKRVCTIQNLEIYKFN